MKIEHVALWVTDLELVKAFYENTLKPRQVTATTILKRVFHHTF